MKIVSLVINFVQLRKIKHMNLLGKLERSYPVLLTDIQNNIKLNLYVFLHKIENLKKYIQKMTRMFIQQKFHTLC